MPPRLRFAPSPTGDLHVGGARTALFNWLYARHLGGQFLLRIEDTDRERSTEHAVRAIFDGLTWLGLDWDEEPLFQHAREAAHRAAAAQLLQSGHAYRCYCTTSELEQMREEQRAHGAKPRYNGRCRHRSDAPDLPFVVRFKTPSDGSIAFDDLIKGRMVVANDELDDLVLQRSDGTPTYNLAVVCDDAAMRITHVIRGDDHVNNTFRQLHLYRALGLTEPAFGHMPLILGDDGAKLSKRHGATSVFEYARLGYLPAAMRNHLARLGWSHGDQEHFTTDELIAAFDIHEVGSSPSVFALQKLDSLNGWYLRNSDLDELTDLFAKYLDREGIAVEVDHDRSWLRQIVAAQRERTTTFKEMAEKSGYFFRTPLELDEEAAHKHLRPVVLEPLRELRDALAALDAPLTAEAVKTPFEAILARHELKMGKLAQPARVALTGSAISPGIFDVIEITGKQRCLDRLDAALAYVERRATGELAS
ncbi:MAG: glutamate--tRNA ligase [Nitrospirae bacterium CG18_big_fil_WC_8_21_14_2_50_70_55]|nr:MAG: glutamate--tRNA ligase [Nitrospirae bacterium CG18_big_fil_WC_8_21_14_2_50_70_55]